jgi:hypothetical protein
MGEEYVTICVACTKGVTKENMQYVNGMVFHPECYQKHGKDFHVVDHEVAKNAARLKVDLVQLKNLKLRKKAPSKAKSKPRKVKKKGKKSPVKKRQKTKTKKVRRQKLTKKARKVSKRKSKRRVKSSKKRARKRR